VSVILRKPVLTYADSVVSLTASLREFGELGGIQRHRFWNQSKACNVSDFLLVNNTTLYSLSRRFQDIADYLSNFRCREGVRTTTTFKHHCWCELQGGDGVNPCKLR